MKKFKWIILILVWFGTGCSSSKITTSWKDENSTPEKYNKILVLGLIRDVDRTLQQHMEDHMVGDLKGLGYYAVSSLTEFGPKVFDKMEEEAAIEKLKNSGIDAVITIVMLDKQKENKYIPGNVFYTPYSFYYNRFWGYRTTLYRRIYEPGYYVTETKYFWESNLYKMSNQKLVYSVQTESFDPVNAESMAHEYGKMILEDMVKQNVLKQ
jgi:hypothetical protein